MTSAAGASPARVATMLAVATSADVPALFEMLLALGADDGVAEVRTTAQSLHDALFCATPQVFANLVCLDDAIAGFTLHSWKWGTFTGTRDLYLNALYVRPEHRRRGVARATMSALARVAVAQGGSRIEWLTVRAKADTAAFYDAIGSTPADHMAVRRLHGDALQRLARVHP